MRAARLVAYNKPLTIEDIPVPNPEGEAVLIKVKGAGLCHSDLHLIAGEFEALAPVPLPFTPGHEITGTVAKLGPSARGFQEGDPVLVFGGWGCGQCRFCLAGEGNLCDFPLWAGLMGTDGGYADYVLVPSFRYLLAAPEVDLVDAAPVTDAVLTAYRAVGRLREAVRPGSGVAIIGSGALGMAGLQLAKWILGVPVAVLDIDPAKRDWALKSGATLALDPRDEGTMAELNQFCLDGIGGVIDFVGSADSLGLASQIVAKTGQLVLVGLAGGTLSVPAPLLAINEVRVTGVMWGSQTELREVLTLYQEGKVRIPVESRPLDQVNDALNKLRAGRVMGRLVLAL